MIRLTRLTEDWVIIYHLKTDSSKLAMLHLKVDNTPGIVEFPSRWKSGFRVRSPTTCTVVYRVPPTAIFMSGQLTTALKQSINLTCCAQCCILLEYDKVFVLPCNYKRKCWFLSRGRLAVPYREPIVNQVLEAFSYDASFSRKLDIRNYWHSQFRPVSKINQDS